MLSGNNRNPGCNRPRKHGQGLPCATIACFPPACLSSAATLFVQTLEGVEGNERGAERTVWNKSIAKWFRTRKWGTVRDKVGRRYCQRVIRTFGEDCKLFFKYILRYRRTIVSFFFYESWVRFWTHDKISTLRDLIVEDGHLVWWHEIFVIVFYVYTYFIIFIRWIE